MASLNLERSDLLQLDPISAKGTLKLLPLGKKNKVSPTESSTFVSWLLTIDVLFCAAKVVDW